MSHITIFYGLPDTNPGGTALGIGLINVLKKWFPDYEILLMSSHGDRALLNDAHELLLKKFPNLEIFPFPFRVRRDFKGNESKSTKVLHAILWLYYSMKSLICLIQPKLFAKNKSISQFIKSRIVIGRGTNIFYDTIKNSFAKKAEEFVSLYNLCFPILLANRCKIPSVLYAQSFGPLHSSINKRLVASTLKKCSLILSREKYSTDLLVNTLHVSRAKIETVPDSVFALERPSDLDVKSFLKRFQLRYKGYAVFIPRSIKSPEIVSNELKIFSNIGDFLIVNHIVDEIQVMTHCHQLSNYDRFESDEDIATVLVDTLIKDHPDKIKLIDQSLSPDELLNLYGGAKFTFSARLHASIFSLISRTPTFSFVLVGNKTRGIFEQSGLNKYLIDTSNFIQSDLQGTIKSVNDGYLNEVGSIDEKMIKLNLAANKTPQRFANLGR